MLVSAPVSLVGEEQGQSSAVESCACRQATGSLPDHLDIKIAAMEDCAHFAEELAKTYGSLTAAGCQAVADKIRQEMAHLCETHTCSSGDRSTAAATLRTCGRS